MDGLRSMGVPHGGVLFVHSSMKAIGPVEGGAECVLDVLSKFLSAGLLVLPSHSWDQIEKGNFVFDPKETRSCVGILSNLFMRRPGVFRSLHPTHSVAALGIGAESFVSGEEWTDTPCSREGCYGKLYDMGAQVLFLGCSLKRNTLLHGVEEWNSIPGRITETTALFRIRMPASPSLSSSSMRRRVSCLAATSRSCMAARIPPETRRSDLKQVLARRAEELTKIRIRP
mgnify:CR=1 FL=1